MIRLEVEEYCQECLDFTPEVVRPGLHLSSDNEIVDVAETIVRCKYRKRCAGITRYLDRQMKGEVQG